MTTDDTDALSTRPTTSTRDPVRLRAQLGEWLTTTLPAGADPVILGIDAPEGNVLSSETVLLDATWSDDSGRREESLVVRIAPSPDAVPVFPTYDLERQARVMRLVRERTDVPIPAVRWVESDPSVLGSPFFVMTRIDGIVPPDIMPYTIESWLSEATTEQRARLEGATVGVLAGLHGIPDAASTFDFLTLPGDDGASSLRRHVDDQRRYYDWVVSDGQRSPVIEACFDWLEDRWPVVEGPPVLSWGDSRIGNVMYRDFEPVAVLDWEMAAVGPRELDLAWMIYLHRFFQDLSEQMEMPGLPRFLRRDDAAATYESLSGHAPRDLDWFMAYGALRHGIIMFRIARRSIHFGEAERPDDPDDMILHRGTIEAMLDGSYWARL